MKIAVNTRLLLKNKLEGIGWFTYEHFSRIVKDHPEHEFYFLFDRPFDKSFVFAENVTPLIISPPTRHPVLQYFWFERQLPRVFKKIQPDLFISPDNYNSLKSKHKNLLVIHDLNFEHFPKFLPLKDRWFLRHFVRQYVQKANHIVTVSEYSKNDIIKQYGVEPEKIDMVYNGANKNYAPINEKEKISTREKLTKGSPYFVYVGAFNPRKNIARLLEAFDLYKKETNSDTKLVLVGETMYRSKKTEFLLNTMHHLSDVIFTGRKESAELKLIIGSALALTYIPLFEGFGIPVVEAFKSEIPVITSNTTSLPEVARNAALLVDPTNISSIVNAMKKITFDEDLRNELIEKGKERGKEFSWDHAANEFWKSIEKTLKAN
ncbi:MAG: glycosyltransferase family 4 protein [Bacteroidales bacterium]|nr:glycosyltransferase family 4 protein [Bacteroidales bacterium]